MEIALGVAGNLVGVGEDQVDGGPQDGGVRCSGTAVGAKPGGSQRSVMMFSSWVAMVWRRTCGPKLFGLSVA